MIKAILTHRLGALQLYLYYVHDVTIHYPKFYAAWQLWRGHVKSYNYWV